MTDTKTRMVEVPEDLLGEVCHQYRDRDDHKVDWDLMNRLSAYYTMARSGYDPDAVLADPRSHPKHTAIAAINKRIRDYGEEWSKCVNCGEPYQVTPEGNATVCSPACAREFDASMNEPF